MEEKHSIRFIEVLTGDQVLRAETNVGHKTGSRISCWFKGCGGSKGIL
jgi:desulfoferrodoxin (superoxide reductase-like protein)